MTCLSSLCQCFPSFQRIERKITERIENQTLPPGEHQLGPRNPYRPVALANVTVEAMYHLNKQDPVKWSHRELAKTFGLIVPAVRAFLR